MKFKKERWKKYIDGDDDARDDCGGVRRLIYFEFTRTLQIYSSNSSKRLKED